MGEKSLLTFLTGESEVLKEKYIEKIASSLEAKKIRFSAEQLEDAVRYLSQPALFEENIVIEIPDFDKWKKEWKNRFLKAAEHAHENIAIIVRTSRSVSSGGETITLSCPKPWEESKWNDYILQRLSANGIDFHTGVAEALFKKIGPNDWLIEREIEKLSTLDKKITIDDVESFVFNHCKTRIDELCFSISEMRFSKTWKVLSQLLSYEDPVVITASIAKHFVDLFKVVASVEVKKSYSWPYISKLSKELQVPSVRLARFLGFKFKGQKHNPFNHTAKYSLSLLEKILKILQELDKEIKIQKVQSFTLLSHIVKIKKVLEADET